MAQEKEKIIMNDDDAILKLLSLEDVLPRKTVRIERLGINVVLQALRAKDIFRIRQKNLIYVKNSRGQMVEQLDEENFNVALIVAATVSPNWGDERLLKKFEASSAEEVVKNILLAGELDQLGNIVLELSGFGEELEEVKN